jgi:hypothetical protein
MPFVQADIDLLKLAIASRQGARSITFSDQSVTFESIGDMVRLLALMEADVAVTESSTTPRTRYAVVSKGV